MPLKHDPLYKDLIQNLFKDFMEFAFEDIYKHIDFKTVKFLDKEVVDIFEGIERKLDVLAEATVKGKKEIIYIHIEIESSRKKEFPFRMWEYFSIIHRKFKKPVIPIALFVDDHKWSQMLPDKYEVSFLNHTFLSFNYKQIKLKNFKARDYIKSQNPIIQALLVKMDLADIDAKKIKLEILRYLFSQNKRVGKNKPMLYNFIETYLRLPPKEDAEVKKEIIRQEPEAKMLIKTYFEEIEEKGIQKGIEKGIQKGIEKGIEKGKILAKIASFEEELTYHQFELDGLNASLKSNDITQKYFDRTGKVISAKLIDARKELSLLKNQLKKLNTKKK